MLEIKTIWGELGSSTLFDAKVNEALAEGWELVRREVLPPRQVATAPTLLYAELERVIETEEEEEPEDDGLAEWVVSRNPSAPYRCNKCGHSTATPAPRCPGCERTMVSYRG
jgi:lipopolysaccharide biosynthesis regulator YciM